MYNAPQLLSQIDAHAWWILGGFAVAMLFQWIWLVACIRMAQRDRVYSMPLFCTFFWFAHDTGCGCPISRLICRLRPLVSQMFLVGLFGAALLIRRRGPLGQTVLMWSTFTGMTVFWLLTTGIFYGAGFRSWPYLGAGAVAVLGGAAMTYLVSTRSALGALIGPPRDGRTAGPAPAEVTG